MQCLILPIIISGTPIPQGLHIRHNLQTGVTEAKLMDDKEEKSSDDNLDSPQQNSLTVHPEKLLSDEENRLLDKEEATNKMKIPIDELKAMLKKIKSDENDASLHSNVSYNYLFLLKFTEINKGFITLEC